MRAIVLALGAAKVEYRTFWGFDSLSLPDERDDDAASKKAAAKTTATAPHPPTMAREPSAYRTVVERQWHQGAYNAADAMSSFGFATLSNKIREYILGTSAALANVDLQWIRGYYEHSLTGSSRAACTWRSMST